jgi:hypothetical protein
MVDYKVLTKADSKYEKLLPPNRGQTLLMSALFSLENKRYRVIGTVKKSLFGKIKDYNFIDFVVVEEAGHIIRERELTKRIYTGFITLLYMNTSEAHIQNSILNNPAYFIEPIERYQEMVEIITPVFSIFKKPLEFYMDQLNKFYDYLIASHETNIKGDELARELKPVLQRAKSLNAMSIKEVEQYKALFNQFAQIINQRTLLVLRNKEVFLQMKLILETCNARKEIQLDSFAKEAKLMLEIIKGSRAAITTTMINADLEQKITSIEVMISQIEDTKKRGTIVDDIANKQFNNQWLIGKEVSV